MNELSDELIEEALKAALYTPVPGGAEVWVWLPQADAWTPSETAKDVLRCALRAAYPIFRKAVLAEVAAPALLDRMAKASRAAWPYLQWKTPEMPPAIAALFEVLAEYDATKDKGE